MRPFFRFPVELARRSRLPSCLRGRRAGFGQLLLKLCILLCQPLKLLSHQRFDLLQPRLLGRQQFVGAVALGASASRNC